MDWLEQRISEKKSIVLKALENLIKRKWESALILLSPVCWVSIDRLSLFVEWKEELTYWELLTLEILSKM